MTHAAPPSPPLWCRRNAAGHIVALNRQALSAQEQQAGGWESVQPGDVEVDAFAREVSSQINPLSQTDASLARVLEDLIDVLINRSVIQFTDLPEAARAKLFQRRQTRADLTHRLDLLPDEGDHGFL
jgi:hypothetical protein